MQPIHWYPFSCKLNVPYNLPSTSPFLRFNSVFNTKFGNEPPGAKLIHHWFAQFMEIGNMLQQKSPGRLHI